jgi:replicative DNA helicase
VREVEDYRRWVLLRDALARAHELKDVGQYDEAVKCVTTAAENFPSNGSVEVSQDCLHGPWKPTTRINRMPTTLSTLDSWLEGGPAAGDLASVMAPTSGGKTGWLIWCCHAALSAGKRAAYVTLEVPEEEIRDKLRRCLLGKKDAKQGEWEKKRKELHGKNSALYVVEDHPYSLTVERMDHRIPVVDLILIDYADFLSAGSEGGSEYSDLGRIYANLKKVGKKRKIPVWTASQVNREGYGAGTIGLCQVEASLRKVMTADVVLTLNSQEEPDEDTGNCRVGIHVAKNRHGVRMKTLDATVNWAVGTFTEGKWT